jgi:1,2-diacylglycerol 3-alpha-glucosyltransferase
MRVAIFTNNFYPRLSGVSVAVNFLNSSLNEMGHETLVIAPDYGYGKMVKGVEVFRVESLYLMPLHVSVPLRNIDQKKVRKVIKNWKPDIIHSHHPFMLGNSAMSMADEFGLPLVYTFHTLYDHFAHYVKMDMEPVKENIRDFVARYANRCQLVIAPTPPIKEYLETSVGVKTKVEAVSTGIDFSRFKNVNSEQINTLKAKYGLDKFDKVLMNVGRMSKEKNVFLCFNALKELTERGKNCGLLLIGDGPEVGNLQEEAEKAGLKDRLIMGGFLDQETLAAAYFLGDVFLFPSLSDTQGIVLYEAMAGGMPVVATETMASQAAVKPNLNGLFAEDNPKDFADKISNILDNPQQFAEPFDTNAFSHKSIGQTYDRLYKEALEKGREIDIKATRKIARFFEDVWEKI